MRVRSLIFFLPFVFVQQAAAQNITKSPYSRFGVGEMQPGGFAQQRLMGGTAMSHYDTSDYTILNPATYANMKLTVVQTGLSGANATFSNRYQSQQVSLASFNYLSIGFPLLKKERLGTVFGLVPYSAMGYNTSSTIADTSGPGYKNSFQGRGGLSRVYLGLAKGIGKKLSVGVNANFIFGQLQSTIIADFPDSTALFDYREDQTSYVNGFQFDAGVQYASGFRSKRDTTREWYHSAGATVNISAGLRARREFLAKSILIYQGNEFLRDTVFFDDAESGTILLPLGWSAGYGIGVHQKWFVNAEYSNTYWSDFSMFGVKNLLADNFRAGLGGFWIPGWNDDLSKNYMARVTYRGGLSYGKSGISLDGSRLTEYGLSLGMSFPFRTYRGARPSYLHFGAEYLQRVPGNTNLVTEQYFRVHLGFNFNDEWFRKRKYD